MQLLTILTLIYVTILVVALAVSLIVILYYLYRISLALGEVKTALATVTENSEPLETQMELLKETVAGAAHSLDTAAGSLGRARESLEAMPGVGEPSP